MKSAFDYANDIYDGKNAIIQYHIAHILEHAQDMLYNIRIYYYRFCVLHNIHRSNKQLNNILSFVNQQGMYGWCWNEDCGSIYDCFKDAISMGIMTTRECLRMHTPCEYRCFL